MQLTSTDALLVIDVQIDFLPGGALAVKGGDAILPGINALARHFDHVILTQDWHPGGHISFAASHKGKRAFLDTAEAAYGTQTLWPEHTVQGSRGADLAPALDIPHAELILRKGFRKSVDSYSAFLENDRRTATGLAGFLRDRGLKRLFFCGLAYDFCVGFSALDAVRLGFEAWVVRDLTRAVNLPGAAANPGAAVNLGSVERTQSAFAEAGVGQLRAANLLAPPGKDDGGWSLR